MAGDRCFFRNRVGFRCPRSSGSSGIVARHGGERACSFWQGPPWGGRMRTQSPSPSDDSLYIDGDDRGPIYPPVSVEAKRVLCQSDIFVFRQSGNHVQTLDELHCFAADGDWPDFDDPHGVAIVPPRQLGCCSVPSDVVNCHGRFENIQLHEFITGRDPKRHRFCVCGIRVDSYRHDSCCEFCR